MAKHDSKGVRELTPTERNACISIKSELLKKHSFKNVSTEAEESRVKRAFEQEAMDRLFALGLKARVHWEPEVYEMPDKTCKLVWEPEVEIYDRVDGTGDLIDYELIQREVRAGEADGKQGHIREDGTWHEDAQKKDIF